MASAVFERIKATGELPSPSGVALEVLQIAKDPSAKIVDIAAIVEKDPASAARILKFVNSAFFGVSNKIASLHRAIILLGMRTVVNLSLGYSLISQNMKGRCDTFDYDDFWLDSLARRRSPAIGYGDLNANEAFTCGLLSQVGRLAMATVYPREYGQVLNFVRANTLAKVTDVERRIFELDHNQLTAEMLADWHLPEYFGKAVCAQDAPFRAGLAADSIELQLGGWLSLGGLMAPMFARWEVKRTQITSLLTAAHRMRISPNHFGNTFAAVGEIWRDAGELFTLKTGPVASWREVYAKAS